jgi:protein TonB
MAHTKYIILKTLSLSLLLGSFAGLQAAVSEGADFDVRPIPVKTPPPAYPTSLRQTGVSGLVALKVEIDESGNVTECSVSKSTNPEFDGPAMQAVKGWKFKPAQKSGAAVKIRLVIPIKFNIDE